MKKKRGKKNALKGGGKREGSLGRRQKKGGGRAEWTENPPGGLDLRGFPKGELRGRKVHKEVRKVREVRGGYKEKRRLFFPERNLGRKGGGFGRLVKEVKNGGKKRKKLFNEKKKRASNIFGKKRKSREGMCSMREG